MERDFPWWIIAVAAVMAALTLVNTVGWEIAVALAAAVITGAAGYRWYRARHPERPPGVVCLRCGSNLAATARSCPHCGSAQWTWKN